MGVFKCVCVHICVGSIIISKAILRYSILCFDFVLELKFLKSFNLFQKIYKRKIRTKFPIVENATENSIENSSIKYGNLTDNKDQDKLTKLISQYTAYRISC